MRAQASRSTRTITFVVFALTIFFFAFFENSKNIPWLAAANPFADDPYDAVGSFGIQLSFLGALVSMIRAFRPYPTKEIPPAQSLLILRGEAVALLSMIVTLTSDIAAMFRYPSLWKNSSAGWILAGLVCGFIVLTILISLPLYRIASHMTFSLEKRIWTRAILFPVGILILAVYPIDLLESIAGGIFTALVGMMILFLATWSLVTVIFPSTKMEFEDVFDDFGAMYNYVKSRMGFISYLEKVRMIEWLHNVFDWINPRKHKWKLILIIALFMGGSLMLAEALNEGLSTNINIVLLLWTIFLGIEGAGVVLGYFLFGEFLGIFR